MQAVELLFELVVSPLECLVVSQLACAGARRRSTLDVRADMRARSGI